VGRWPARDAGMAGGERHYPILPTLG